MADQQRTVLVSVNVDANEAIKEIIALTKDTDNLRKVQAELDLTTAAGAADYELLAGAIRNNNKEIAERRRVIDNTIKAEEAQNGSLKEMRATINVLTQQYSNLSKAERESAKGEELQKKLAATTEEVKQLEQAYGDYRRSVGNYEKAALGLVKTNNAVTDSLIQSTMAGNSMKQSFGAMAQGAKQASAALAKLLLNPVVLVFAAIVGVIALVAKAMKRSEETTAKLSAAFKGLTGLISGLLAALEPLASFIADGLVVALDALASAFDFVLRGAEKVFNFFGASTAANMTKTIQQTAAAARELAQAEYELTKAQRDLTGTQKTFELQEEKLRQVIGDTTKTLQERLDASKELGNVLQNHLQAELAIAQKAVTVAELRLKTEGATKEALDAQSDALDNLLVIQAALEKQVTTQLNQEAALRKEAADKAKEAAAKALDITEKRLTAENRMLQEQLRAEAGYLSADFKTRQQYAAKEFQLAQDLQRRVLELRKATNKNYEAELAALDSQLQAFRNKQVAESEAYNAQALQRLDALLQKNTDEQIQAVKDKYAEAAKTLGEIQVPVRTTQTAEEFAEEMDMYARLLFDQTQTLAKLEKQQQEEIRKVREQGQAQTAELIGRQLSAEYTERLAAVADNEREALALRAEAIKKEIEMRRAAGLSVAQLETELRNVTAQAYRKQLDVELLNSELTAKQKYELVKKELEDERALYEGNAGALAEIDAAQLEAYQQYLDARTDAFDNYTSNVMEAATQMNAILSAGETAQLQKYEKDNKKKKDDLKKRLDAGLIAQANYDEQVAELDAELDAKKAETAQKQAKREKALNVFAVGIDTAKGVMKAIAESPLTFGLPWSAFVAATGALQIAAILAEPLPQAARGAYVQGDSHAQGGVNMNVEGGEVIINKRSAAKYLDVLSAINEDGGGVAFVPGAPALSAIRDSGAAVPFNVPYSDGGYMASANADRAAALTYDEVYNAMADAVADIQVIATIEDIRRGDKNYTTIADRASYR